MVNDSKLEVEYVDIATLIPYARNSKEHPEEQIQNIVNSMNEFGMCDPIGVWTNPQGELEIVEGHGRVLALNEIGEGKAPIIRLDHLTDEQRRAYSHVHNQTTLTSGLDEEMFAMDMDELDFQWEDFGFDVLKDEGYGTEFMLPSEDGPQFKTVSLHMTPEQYELFSEVSDELSDDIDDDDGGNRPARIVCEVINQWRASKISR